MKILAVECSATPASCAILENDKIIAESFVNVKLTHSQTLLPMIDATLKSAMLSVSDIDGFAIAAGPGSFTGVRIGISAVKGLGAADKKPCAPVSTLLAMAYRLRYFNGIVCAVMDARCNQVYNALFKCEKGIVTRLTEDRALMANQLAQELEGVHTEHSLPITIMGDGAEMFYEYARDFSFVSLADETLRYQHAVGVALAAKEEFEKNNTVTPAELLPSYLRLPQAERELKSKRGL